MREKRKKNKRADDARKQNRTKKERIANIGRGREETWVCVCLAERLEWRHACMRAETFCISLDQKHVYDRCDKVLVILLYCPIQHSLVCISSSHSRQYAFVMNENSLRVCVCVRVRWWWWRRSPCTTLDHLQQSTQKMWKANWCLYARLHRRQWPDVMGRHNLSKINRWSSQLTDSMSIITQAYANIWSNQQIFLQLWRRCEMDSNEYSYYSAVHVYRVYLEISKSHLAWELEFTIVLSLTVCNFEHILVSYYGYGLSAHAANTSYGTSFLRSRWHYLWMHFGCSVISCDARPSKRL